MVCTDRKMFVTHSVTQMVIPSGTTATAAAFPLYIPVRQSQSLSTCLSSVDVVWLLLGAVL